MNLFIYFLVRVFKNLFFQGRYIEGWNVDIQYCKIKVNYFSIFFLNSLYFYKNMKGVIDVYFKNIQSIRF